MQRAAFILAYICTVVTAAVMLICMAAARSLETAFAIPALALCFSASIIALAICSRPADRGSPPRRVRDDSND